MPRHRTSLRLRSELKRQAAERRPDHEPTRLEAAEPVATESIAPAPAPAALPTRHSSASAVAKLILCGEHAVVYGRPAIALPLAGIRARVDVADDHSGSGITVHARDLRRRWCVANDPHGSISQLITNVLAYFETQQAPSPAHPYAPSPDLHVT